jgi:hypothetical protein
MFEPLMKLFGEKADSLTTEIAALKPQLAQIVNNTESEVNFVRIGQHNNQVEIPEGETSGQFELRPREGRMWRLTSISVTGKKSTGVCAVYLGAVSNQNLIDVISPAGLYAGARRYYVPSGSSLFFRFYEQEKGTCTAMIQVEEYEYGSTVESQTGKSSESISPVLRAPGELPRALGLTKV